MKELIKHCFTCELLFGGGYDELRGSPGYGGTSFDGGYGVDWIIIKFQLLFPWPRSNLSKEKFKARIWKT